MLLRHKPETSLKCHHVINLLILKMIFPPVELLYSHIFSVTIFTNPLLSMKSIPIEIISLIRICYEEIFSRPPSPFPFLLIQCISTWIHQPIILHVFLKYLIKSLSKHAMVICLSDVFPLGKLDSQIEAMTHSPNLSLMNY